MPSTTTLTLGRFHRYPARYPGSVLQLLFDEAARRLGHRPSNVLDPFCGTGATMAAARQLGVASVGIELTYLGQLVSRVRLNPPDDVERAFARGLGIFEEPLRVRRSSVDPALQQWMGNINSVQLTQYLRRLERVGDEREREWLTVALSDSLRPASVWLPGSIKPQRDPEREPPSLCSSAVTALRRLYQDTLMEPDNGISATVMEGDARNLIFGAGQYEAVITSPPYFTMYDYFDVQRLSYLAFGWPTPTSAQIGRSSRISPDGVGFQPPRAMRRWYSAFDKERTIQGRALRAYWNDMHSHLREAFRVLVPGGVVVYAIANTRRQGRLFNLVDSTAELMERVGFTDVEAQKRFLTSSRILPAGRDAKTGRFSANGTAPLTEWVLTAQKHG